MLRGAIIFIIAFLLFFVVTLGYQDLPPGRAIYDAIVQTETEYPILGIPATTLVASVFNGVIYGVIIWLIYTLDVRAGIIPSGKGQVTPQ